MIHPNLGRGLLAGVGIGAAVEARRGAVALELALETGKRGDRDDHLRALVCELTGAEDATLVNNNAAAVLLTLNTLAGHGGGAVVSRGELIEIGGGVRMPGNMARAGGRVVEGGTADREHGEERKAGVRRGGGPGGRQGPAPHDPGGGGFRCTADRGRHDEPDA